MKATFFPLDDNVSSGVFALMADTLSRSSFAPANAEPIGRNAVASPLEHVSLWERFDRWMWKQMQKEREAYLAASTDVVDLEERMRRLERSPISFIG